MKELEKISQRLLQYLRQQGLNQNQLAEILGISRQTVSSIMTRKSSITTEHLLALQQRFGRLAVDWILFGDGETPPRTAQAGYPKGRDVPERKAAEPQANYDSNSPEELAKRLAWVEEEITRMKDKFRNF